MKRGQEMIGIIAAMEEETRVLLAHMTDKKEIGRASCRERV